MNPSKEFSIRVKQPEGWPCPQCGGIGQLPNAQLALSTGRISYRTGTECGLCDGKGRVEIIPLEDAGAKRYEAHDLHLALATCSGVLLAIKDEVRWTTEQKRTIENALAMAQRALSGAR